VFSCVSGHDFSRAVKAQKTVGFSLRVALKHKQQVPSLRCHSQLKRDLSLCHPERTRISYFTALSGDHSCGSP
jgi:hypothetical protein